jgi:hypothetical protein
VFDGDELSESLIHNVHHVPDLSSMSLHRGADENPTHGASARRWRCEKLSDVFIRTTVYSEEVMDAFGYRITKKKQDIHHGRWYMMCNGLVSQDDSSASSVQWSTIKRFLVYVKLFFGLEGKKKILE